MSARDSLPHVAAWLDQQVWSIDAGAFEMITAIRDRRVLEGTRLELTEIRARTGRESAQPRQQLQTSGVVGIIPVHGAIFPRANMLTEVSATASADVIGREVDRAVADPDIRAIVLDVDSPGGAVFGIEELARRLHAARRIKPLVAVANYSATSAAYWLASQASEVCLSQTGQVGAIGVFAEHVDHSQAEAREGRRTTLVRAGRYKAEDHPSQPLTADARKAWQARVNAYYDLFVKAVARGRGAALADVRSGYGEGRVLVGPAALRAGLADRLETLAEVVGRLQSPQGRQAVTKMAGLRACSASRDDLRRQLAALDFHTGPTRTVASIGRPVARRDQRLLDRLLRLECDGC